ncbi:MAG: dihydrofolate synthase [Bacteroidetes bacterium SW_9_63_38]|nr:MAG: dihydrofolate synthase [Bacteroidetes bacterium SW_9_63_38]
MSRTDAVEYLLGLPQYANDDSAHTPGLDRIEALMEGMGRPHESIRTVHVAGTNGKGSVSSMIAATATAAGLKTGLHTSPHLTHVEQRMRVDGPPAPGDWLADRVTEYRDLFDRVEASFFEVTVALSFLYFAEQQVDLAVVEVGLGGRLDATNVLHPALSIITNIDLDHTDLLGDTVAEIAREKAGITKPDTPVLSAVTQPEAQTVIEGVAQERGAPLRFLRSEVSWWAPHATLSGSVIDVETPLRDYDRLHVSLPGTHQQTNAALALRAAELVIPAVQADAAPVHDGLADVHALTGFRGRLDVLQDPPLVVVDVAHNPASIKAGLETLDIALTSKGGSLYVCFNAVQGKQLGRVGRLLADRDAQVIPVPVDTPRALSTDAMVEGLRDTGVTVLDPRPLAEALADFQRFASASDALLLTGSHKMMELLPDAWRTRQ